MMLKWLAIKYSRFREEGLKDEAGEVAQRRATKWIECFVLISR